MNPQLKAKTNMKTLYSKYPGTCATCGKPFPKGELIKWSRGCGASHVVCHSRHQDNCSHEDRDCGDMAYEDRCAAACGLGL